MWHTGRSERTCRLPACIVSSQDTRHTSDKVVLDFRPFSIKCRQDFISFGRTFYRDDKTLLADSKNKFQRLLDVLVIKVGIEG